MNPGDLTTLDNAKAWLGLSGLAIAGIANANPAVVTLLANPPTPLSSGLSVGLSGINGMTELNGTEQVITVQSPLTFSVPVDSTAFGTYTNGGIVSITDSLMQRLISSCSTYVQNWAARTFRNLPYVETRDGTGGDVLPLVNYPVTGVSSVVVNGVTIQPRPALNASSQQTSVGFTGFPGPSGYVWDANRLILVGGYYFARGRQNVQVSYAGGFLVSNEPQSVPGSAPFVLATQAYWNAGDRGVTYANGTPLAVEPYGTSLTVGQYSVDSNGTYYFAAADAGAAVLISYGYTPFDVEQGVVDIIGDWFKYRNRIGTTAMAIEQQTITFVNTPMPARAKDTLMQYRRTNFFSP